MSISNKSLSDVGQFYKQVDDFKEKIIKILMTFGKDKEIIELKKYHDKLTMLKKANVRAPIELFYKHVISTYAEYILKRDDQFFLGKLSDIERDYPSDEKAKEVIELHDLFFIGQIRGIWEQLTPQVKGNIWKYIQIICLLSEKVVGGKILSNKREQLKNDGKIS